MNKTSPRIRLGTSSWTAKGWLGSFYPSGTPQKDFLPEYAKHFDTVEIDSTFYAIPRRSAVEAWRDRTPPGFLFSAKAPQVITHEKFLEDCGDELRSFLDTIALLGDKLGPILFQFPYYAKRTGISQEEFVRRFTAFTTTLPANGFSFAVEVRNKQWLNEALLEPLAKHGISLALIDHPWMLGPDQLLAKSGILTGPFAYIRWLGDRKGIEKITTVWDKPVVDREPSLRSWAGQLQQLIVKGLEVRGYVNNHYSGHAPHDIETLKRLLAAG